MLFQASVPIVNGATGADPVTDPGDVPPEMIAGLPVRPPGCDIMGRRLLLALDGDGAETVTISLYALDESTYNANADAPDMSARRFYAFATGQVITNGVLSEITAKVPPGGAVYVRVTADAVGANRVLRLACVP